jgi:hypothetical protein
LLRPINFGELDAQKRWDIDKRLGILDWDGTTADEKPEIDVWIYVESPDEIYGWALQDWVREMYNEQYHDRDDGPTWYEYVRPLEISRVDLREMNGEPHCIFGQIESVSQGDGMPDFLHLSDPENLTVRRVSE